MGLTLFVVLARFQTHVLSHLKVQFDDFYRSQFQCMGCNKDILLKRDRHVVSKEPPFKSYKLCPGELLFSALVCSCGGSCRLLPVVARHMWAQE